MKTCLECSKPIVGRKDKKFCSEYCRSAYHYQKNREKEKSLFKSIEQQLKKNRRILMAYNKAGKATILKNTLLEQGFNPKYFTHYWKAQNGNVYLFCYEFGFMLKTENNKAKYVLVQWQSYMK